MSGICFWVIVSRRCFQFVSGLHFLVVFSGIWFLVVVSYELSVMFLGCFRVVRTKF